MEKRYMFTYVMKNIPDYMDDRTTLGIMLSDDLTYRSYRMVNSNLVSSWYDTTQQKAFTAICMADVPIEHRGSLVQHTTSTNSAGLMYPNDVPDISVASTSKKMSFPAFPEYYGDSFKVFWDTTSEECPISTYNSKSLVSDFCHTYDEYGKHTIRFSANVRSLQLTSKFDRIIKIDSRSSNFYKMTNLKYCRNVESIKVYELSNIGTDWFDCYELTSIELPDLMQITCPYSVNCMFNLKKFIAPKLRYMNNATGIFKGNVNLEEVYFPHLTCISGDYVSTDTGKGYNFMTNVSLTAAYLPKLMSGMTLDFAYCVNLISTDFSSLNAVEVDMFRDCISLKEIKLPKVKRIKERAFYRCQNLVKVDLSKNKSVPILDNKNAFSGMPASYEICVNKGMKQQFIAQDAWNEVATHIREV